MKNLNLKLVFLFILFTIFSADTILAQSSAWNDQTVFEVSFKDYNEGAKFKANISSIVINHEEQWDFFKVFKKAVKKSKSLTLKTSNSIPSNGFEAGHSYEMIWIKRAGKTLKLHNVTLESNAKKGNETHIKLKYKSAG